MTVAAERQILEDFLAWLKAGEPCCDPDAEKFRGRLRAAGILVDRIPSAPLSQETTSA